MSNTNKIAAALITRTDYDPRKHRLVIVGGPRSGKTTIADSLLPSGTKVRHTDDLMMTHDWSAASQHVADKWFTEPGPWVIEGVATARALRKWLASNPAGRPCDFVLLLDGAWLELTRGQEVMRKGAFTVWKQIDNDVRVRGIPVIHAEVRREA